MADSKETNAPATATEPVEPTTDDHIATLPNGEPVLPDSWMYRKHRFLKWDLDWYASPRVQLLMVAFVCFLCPGMFNALSGLGGGGRSDKNLADDMNTALYSTFAVVGFFGGTFVNKLGVRLTLGFGGLGYCIYAISLLASLHANVRGFNIFAGALLGVCAGLLWTAQGTIMLSYPGESEKGHFFAWFWAIFNLGGVIGSLSREDEERIRERPLGREEDIISYSRRKQKKQQLTMFQIPLGQNIHVKTNHDVNDGTYIAFIVLMFIGACLATILVNASKVIRRDGSRVVLMKQPSWTSEFIGLYQSIKLEPWIILFFPMFWSSNWFTTYQTNSVNGAYFDTRTKSLNGLLYWLSQIFGAAAFGYCLDLKYFRRTTRAKGALAALFTLTLAIWGGGYAWQKRFTRESLANRPASDWTSPGYAGPMFLYMFYGFYDAAWQCCSYWYMGALSNSGRKAANFVGFYKGLQSAGAAVMWSFDRRSPSFMTEFASNWGLLLGSLVCAAPVIFLRIKDHVSTEEDLVFSDETLADVLPQGHPEKAVETA
ncbi:DUF895 domain membrane protein [Xylogone sp. PMI_703]|nr:DUF895 domain membrane protein [Xylogone sp. PMI_703]